MKIIPTKNYYKALRKSLVDDDSIAWLDEPYNGPPRGASGTRMPYLPKIWKISWHNSMILPKESFWCSIIVIEQHAYPNSHWCWMHQSILGWVSGSLPFSINLEKYIWPTWYYHCSYIPLWIIISIYFVSDGRTLVDVNLQISFVMAWCILII